MWTLRKLSKENPRTNMKQRPKGKNLVKKKREFTNCESTHSDSFTKWRGNRIGQNRVITHTQTPPKNKLDDSVSNCWSWGGDRECVEGMFCVYNVLVKVFRRICKTSHFSLTSTTRRLPSNGTVDTPLLSWTHPSLPGSPLLDRQSGDKSGSRCRLKSRVRTLVVNWEVLTSPTRTQFYRPGYRSDKRIQKERVRS